MAIGRGEEWLGNVYNIARFSYEMAKTNYAGSKNIYKTKFFPMGRRQSSRLLAINNILRRTSTTQLVCCLKNDYRGL